MLYYSHLFVYYGGEPFDTVCDLHLQGTFDNRFAPRICSGDYNGDGYDDLCVFRNISSDLHTTAYRCFEIYEGGPQLSQEPIVYDLGFEIGGFHTVTGEGDIDGDGYLDLLFGYYLGDGYEYSIGILYGEPDLSAASLSLTPYNGYCLPQYFVNANDDDCTDIAMNVYPSEPSEWRIDVFCQYGDTLNLLNPEFTYTADESDYKLVDCIFLNDATGDGNVDFLCVLYPLEYPTDDPVYFTVVTTEYVSVEDETVPPLGTALRCYPNPFQSELTLQLERRSGISEAVVDIYNIRGQKIRSLQLDQEGDGVWNGRDASNRPVTSGVYLCKYRTRSGETNTQRVLMMK